MISDEELRILRAMTPAQKLKVAAQLFNAARRIKAAALRAMHPEWSEDQVQMALRKAILYGRD